MFESNFNVKANPDVPEDIYWQAVEKYSKDRIERIKTRKKYSQHMTELHETYRKQLHSIIGPDNLSKYQKLHKRRMQKMKKARGEIPCTPEGKQTYHTMRESILTSSNKLIKKSGVDISRINTLRTNSIKKAKQITLDTFGNAINPEQPPKKRKNTDYFPPFNAGEWGEAYYSCSNKIAGHIHLFCSPYNYAGSLCIQNWLE